MLFHVCGKLSIVHAPSLNPGISAPGTSLWLNLQLASMLTSIRFDMGGGGEPPMPPPPVPGLPPPPVVPPPIPVGDPPAAPVDVGFPVDVSPVVDESVVEVVGDPP